MATLFAAEAAETASQVASEHCAQPLEALGTAIAQALEVVQSDLVRTGWAAINPAAENPSALAMALETALSNVRSAFGQRDSDGGSGGDSGFSEALKGRLQALANGDTLDPPDVEAGAGARVGGDAASPMATFFTNVRANARERKRKRGEEEAAKEAEEGSEVEVSDPSNGGPGAVS